MFHVLVCWAAVVPVLGYTAAFFVASSGTNISKPLKKGNVTQIENR